MHIPWTPINTVEDICHDKQLEHRGFFVEVEHPELEETFTYPYASAKMSGTPWVKPKQAPLIGEHNLEIYEKELGFSREEITLLATGGVI